MKRFVITCKECGTKFDYFKKDGRGGIPSYCDNCKITRAIATAKASKQRYKEKQKSKKLGNLVGTREVLEHRVYKVEDGFNNIIPYRNEILDILVKLDNLHSKVKDLLKSTEQERAEQMRNDNLTRSIYALNSFDETQIFELVAQWRENQKEYLDYERTLEVLGDLKIALELVKDTSDKLR